MGVKLVAVGTGSKLFAQGFKKSLPWPDEVFLDPQANVYKAANLERWGLMKTLWRFFTNSAVRKVAGLAGKKYPEANMEGDGQQSGGVFVIAPGTPGKILFEFREMDHDPEEFCTSEQILEVCRKASADHDPKPPASL
eukprot:TRINITY_DN678_c0_g2_i1.p2 TRINITY_DN678_c0_g2~~TRINITY_DN678_c0_g2_i1.p2  ORF type:complete len:138 (+),score=28.09 TRINITY_DN678_c0_g2_i1:297-710(+)